MIMATVPPAATVPKKIEIDPFSSGAVRLTMYRDDLILAYGSGFLWSCGDVLAIVTAWHCLTGSHPATGKSLSQNGARPNKVDVSFVAKDLGEVSFLIDLYTPDGDPYWKIHPLGYAEVDLAALFVGTGVPPGAVNQPMNLLPMADVDIQVGSDLFILGYPKNLHRCGLPLWKRASLAIDPSAVLDQIGHRHLLVDAASRTGMSGAPVIARTFGSHMTENGAAVLGGQRSKFVGVYTGRLNSDDELEAQIGMVWPAHYVTELIESGHHDTFS